MPDSADTHRPATHEQATAPDGAALHVLQTSARLLLEYNQRSALIEHHLARLARHLGVEVATLVGYRAVTLVTPAGRTLVVQPHELRINVAVIVGTVRVIDELCAGRITLDEAARRLDAMERTAPRHPRAMLAAIFGVGASALAWLLLADRGAIAVSGVASALGLVARQELGRRHARLFWLPFTAALIGGALAGIAIKVGWTSTAGLCLIVPSLMLVPGPHLINGVSDVFDNHIQPGLCRLGLAVGILVAAALGAFLGGWLTLDLTTLPPPPAPHPLTLPVVVGLAGLAAWGFGAFYNAPWRVLWISIVCGMVGFPTRFLLMQGGMSQEIATLFSCLGIGIVAAVAVGRVRAPFSAISFAGAVPMMPGVFIYEAIAGSLRISAAGRAADPALVVATVALVLKAAFVVGAMTIGLLTGARLVDLATHNWFRRDRPVQRA